MSPLSAQHAVASSDPLRAVTEVQRAIQQAVAQAEREEKQRQQEAARRSAQEERRRKQQDQREARAARERAAVEELRQLCARVKSWWTHAAVPAHAGGRPSPEAIVALLSSERFPATFGKRYEDLTAVELREVSAYTTRCFQSQGALANMQGTERQLITQALMPSRQAAYLQYLEKSASADDALVTLANEAATLTPDRSGAQRWFEIAQQATTILPTAAPRSRETFQATMQKADAAVIATVVPGMVEEALAQAQGVEGLDMLARHTLYGIPPNRYVVLLSPEGRDVREEGRRRLHDGMTQLAQRIAQDERQRIDTWAPGLAALGEGVAWRSEYQRRLAPHASHTRPLQELLTYFRGKREQALRDGEGEFRRIVGVAGNHADLGTIRARYLIDDDKQNTAGAALTAILAEREQHIDRAKALGRTDDTPAPRAAPSSGSADETAQKSARDDVDEDGGPTEEIMYELLRSVLVNATERQNALMAQCGSGPRPEDPAMNQVCLGVMLYKGLTTGMRADAPPPKILEFEKLGCAAAVGKPGYFCEYMMAVEQQLNPMFIGPEAKTLLEGSSLKSARFVRSRSKGWYIVHTADSR